MPRLPQQTHLPLANTRNRHFTQAQSTNSHSLAGPRETSPSGSRHAMPHYQISHTRPQNPEARTNTYPNPVARAHALTYPEARTKTRPNPVARAHALTYPEARTNTHPNPVARAHTPTYPEARHAPNMTNPIPNHPKPSLPNKLIISLRN